MKHHIDRVRAKQEFERFGWHVNSYGAWETNKQKTDKQVQEEFFSALEMSIVCEQEGDYVAQYDPKMSRSH